MLKNILNSNGAQQLSKNELQTINGGKASCRGGSTCPPFTKCENGICEAY